VTKQIFLTVCFISLTALGTRQETGSCLGAKVYARDRTVYLCASRRIANTWDYQISI